MPDCLMDFSDYMSYDVFYYLNNCTHMKWIISVPREIDISSFKNHVNLFHEGYCKLGPY